MQERLAVIIQHPHPLLSEGQGKPGQSLGGNQAGPGSAGAGPAQGGAGSMGGGNLAAAAAHWALRCSVTLLKRNVAHSTPLDIYGG